MIREIRTSYRGRDQRRGPHNLPGIIAHLIRCYPTKIKLDRPSNSEESRVARARSGRIFNREKGERETTRARG